MSRKVTDGSSFMSSIKKATNFGWKLFNGTLSFLTNLNKL